MVVSGDLYWEFERNIIELIVFAVLVFHSGEATY